MGGIQGGLNQTGGLGAEESARVERTRGGFGLRLGDCCVLFLRELGERRGRGECGTGGGAGAGVRGGEMGGRGERPEALVAKDAVGERGV